MKLKVVANALRALGCFLALADITLVSDYIEQNQGNLVRFDTQSDKNGTLFSRIVGRIL